MRSSSGRPGRAPREYRRSAAHLVDHEIAAVPRGPVQHPLSGRVIDPAAKGGRKSGELYLVLLAQLKPLQAGREFLKVHDSLSNPAPSGQ